MSGENGDVVSNQWDDIDPLGREICPHLIVRLWRLPPGIELQAPRLLQWCVACGALRIIVGNRLDFWHLPYGAKVPTDG